VAVYKFFLFAIVVIEIRFPRY